MFPAHYPYEKEFLQKTIDDKLLVYKIDETISKMTIGEKIKVRLMKIRSCYSQKNKERQLFDAEEINAEVLKPSEQNEAKLKLWRFSDIKNIHIKKLKSHINQVNL